MPSTAPLRALIAARFPDALLSACPRRPVVGTGLPELDAILPSGGLDRGRLTAWTPVAGGAALLRGACRHTVSGGERAAWIDAPRSVAGAFWRTGPVLVRPRGPVEALRAAELLARSGGFALVVLDGVEPESTAMVRLSRAAHEGGAALALLARATALAAVRVAARPLPEACDLPDAPPGPRGAVHTIRLQVEAVSSGWRARTELTIPVTYDDLRCAPDPGRSDRRGGSR